MIANRERKRAHLRQAAAPVAALNLPAKQGEGLPPFGPVNPAFATQAVIAVEPATLLLLVGHDPEQVVAVSVPALNVPESQFTQVVPLTFSPGPQGVTQADSAVEAVPAVDLPVGQL